MSSFGPNLMTHQREVLERAKRHAALIEVQREEGIPFAGRGGGKPFPALITDSALLGSGPRRKYAWTELEFDGDDVPVKDGGRSGTTSTDYALNLSERFHTSRYAFGVDKDGGDYPAGMDERPIGGAGTSDTHKYDVPVWMHEVTDVNGDKRYWFYSWGSHDGSCE
jgi:hypothetical protein